MRLGYDQKHCVADSECDASLVTCPCPIDLIFQDGECKECQAEHCLFCEHDETHACDVCELGWHLDFDEKTCIPDDECPARDETCPCAIDEVYHHGECQKCMVDHCLIC